MTEALIQTSVGHAGSISLTMNKAARDLFVVNDFTVDDDDKVSIFVAMNAEGSFYISRDRVKEGQLSRKIVLEGGRSSRAQYRCGLGYVSDHGLTLEQTGIWAQEAVIWEWVGRNGGEDDYHLVIDPPVKRIEPIKRERRAKETVGKMCLLIDMGGNSQAYARGMTAAQSHEILHILGNMEGVNVGFEEKPAT